MVFTFMFRFCPWSIANSFFCWWYEVGTNFIFFYMNIQLFQHHWLQWLPFPPWTSFGVFVKSSCLQLLLGLWGWLLGIVLWFPESLTSRERVGFLGWWFLRLVAASSGSEFCFYTCLAVDHLYTWSVSHSVSHLLQTFANMFIVE